MHFDVEGCKIFECVVGSRAYGTHNASSDMDTKGVCIPPYDVHMSLFKNFEQYEDPGKDRVIYDLGKFFRLAAKCNPTLLEMMWTEESLWLYHNQYWLDVVRNRDIFLCKKYIKNSFTGYAIAQLKRMKTHYEWLHHQPKEPQPEDYGLSHDMLIGKDEIGSFDFLEQEGVKFGKRVQNWMIKVKQYKSDLHQYKNFKNWRKNRNKDRAKIEEKYSMDTKHSYHLVRLSRMGEEFLTTGNTHIHNRKDRDELIAIRNGAWSYEKILAYANELDEKMDKLEKESSLPSKPKLDLIDELYCDIVEKCWRET